MKKKLVMNILSSNNIEAFFVIKVNSAGFGDILRQWYEIFTIGNHLGLKYLHYIATLTLAENHKDNKKSIFKTHPFFQQFKSFKSINHNNYQSISINIQPENLTTGLTQNDLNSIKQQINLHQKNIYILHFPLIYSTPNLTNLPPPPIRFLPFSTFQPQQYNIIIHIRRGDTSFIPINQNQFLSPSGNIYNTFGQLLINEKTIRERYIPIHFYLNTLKEIIEECKKNNKEISQIIICSDGYSIFEKYSNLIKENNQTLTNIKEILNQHEKNELVPLINLSKENNIKTIIYENEKQTNLKEMINISKNCNYLVYGKSCFFQNILKYIYNQHTFQTSKIQPPFYFYLKKEKGKVNIPIKYEGNYLIPLTVTNTNIQRGIVFYRQ